MTKMTALILAASRKGAEDAVAKLNGVSHKCLSPVHGTVMLERVVNAIQASKHVDRIFISIESADILNQAPALKGMLETGAIQFVPSADNLFTSIKNAARTIDTPFPLLISTGDNALHTTEMIDHFCGELIASTSDAVVGMTPAQTILDAYPDGKRAFHELKDGGWSSCNLYGLKDDKALVAARAFETGGQFGKKPARLRKAFGLSFFVKYKFKLATLDGLAEHLSRRWKLSLSPVRMPYADAPIDIDNVGDFHRTEKILRGRQGVS